MNNLTIMYYTADDVSKILGISVTSAYRIIKKLNAELLTSGYIVIPGKVSRKYFESKVMM